MEKRPNSRLQNFNISKKIEKLIERPTDIRQVKGSDNQSVKGFIKYNEEPPQSVTEHFPDFKDVKLINGVVNIDPILKRQQFVLEQLYKVFVEDINQIITGHLN